MAGFARQNLRSKLTLQQLLAVGYWSLLQSQCYPAYGLANICSLGALWHLLRWASHRLASIDWLLAYRARPNGHDNIEYFYDQASMIRNYICRVKVQTSLVKFTREIGLTLRAAYVFRTAAQEWTRDIKAWTKRCIAPVMPPHHVAHCLLRLAPLLYHQEHGDPD